MKSWLSLDKLANLAVIAAAVTFITLSLRGYYQWSPGSPARSADLAQAQIEQAAAAAAIESVENVIVSYADRAAVRTSGNPKVAIIEFSDFQCPYCSRYARGTYPEIQREFVDTGRAAYVFFHLPLEQLHPQAVRASEAAECAGLQQRFWEMRERLFASPASLADAQLVDHARALGLRLPEFQTCLSGATRKRIQTHMAEARRMGVTSTPTFLIGRIEPSGAVRILYRIRGSHPYQVFARAINDALAAPTNVASRHLAGSPFH
jgi:protein-disulfide isomerase